MHARYLIMQMDGLKMAARNDQIDNKRKLGDADGKQSSYPDPGQKITVDASGKLQVPTIPSFRLSKGMVSVWT